MNVKPDTGVPPVLFTATSGCELAAIGDIPFASSVLVSTIAGSSTVVEDEAPARTKLLGCCSDHGKIHFFESSWYGSVLSTRPEDEGTGE